MFKGSNLRETKYRSAATLRPSQEDLMTLIGLNKNSITKGTQALEASRYITCRRDRGKDNHREFAGNEYETRESRNQTPLKLFSSPSSLLFKNKVRYLTLPRCSEKTHAEIVDLPAQYRAFSCGRLLPRLVCGP